MSIESARAFMEKMKTDQEFAKKITEIKGTEARMALVKESGFDFTLADIKNAEGELNEDDLQNVSGGQIPYYGPKPGI